MLLAVGVATANARDFEDLETLTLSFIPVSPVVLVGVSKQDSLLAAFDRAFEWVVRSHAAQHSCEQLRRFRLKTCLVLACGVGDFDA